MRLILHKLPVGQKTVVTDFTHLGPWSRTRCCSYNSPPGARASRRSGPNQLVIPPYFSVAVPVLEELLLGGGELGLFDEGRPPSGVLATLLPAAPIAPVPELAIHVDLMERPIRQLVQ